MSTSDAWLIECDESLSIAVADCEMLELIQAGQCHHVPGSPDYCSSVLVWQENVVPIMNLSALHHGANQQRPGSYLCLLNYQETPNTSLQHLALPVSKAPERIQVNDDQVCELPREYESSLLKPVTLSCFTHHAKPVLILDISGLCSTGFQDLATVA